MGQVINLRKRRAWIELRKILRSGRLVLPRISPRPEPPKTDAGMAFAYMLEAMKRR